MHERRGVLAEHRDVRDLLDRQAATWHLRQAWTPLTFTDDNPPLQDNPVAPARRSARAQAKASCQHDPAGRPYRSFRACWSTWPP